jgi:hypothetical protein
MRTLHNNNNNKPSFYEPSVCPLLSTFLFPVFLQSMAKSPSTATTQKKGIATPQQSQKKVSAYKRRKENRLLFRDLTERFVSKQYVEAPPTAPAPAAADGGVERMELVKLAKDPAMVRKKRQLQRQRQKSRKLPASQKSRQGAQSATTKTTAMETVAVPTKKKKRANKAKTNTASQQQASRFNSSRRQGGMLSFAPPTFHPASSFAGPQGGIVSFATPAFALH